MVVNNELIENLLYGEEGVDLDFKLEQYRFTKASDDEKGEMLKDILAFANSWRRSDAFVLVGVREIKGGRCEVVGIKEKLDDAQVQQFVNGKTQRPITFSYRNVEFEGKCIGIIHIPVQVRPFYLKSDYGKLKKETVYIKRGSSTDIAKLEEIARMGASYIAADDRYPVLEICFADKKGRKLLPDAQTISSLVLSTPRHKDIPDYDGNRSRPLWGYSFDMERPNYDYYRKLVKFIRLDRLLTPMNFAIKNDGSKVARDVRVELKIKDDDSIIEALDEYGMPTAPRATFSTFDHINFQVQNVGISHDLTVQRVANYWLIEASVEKVQPQSVAWISSRLYIGAVRSVDFPIEASIYSDDLPEPTTKRLLIKVEATNRDASLEDIKSLEMERFKNSAEYKKLMERHNDRAG